MDAIATRPHPLATQTGHPLPAQGCRCLKHEGDEPFGDEREGTCSSCGRQVDGKEMPAGGALSLRATADLPARKRRKYGPAQ